MVNEDRAPNRGEQAVQSRDVDTDIETLMGRVVHDHEQTVGFIARLLTLRTGIAGVAVTLWTAALGLAVSNSEPLIAVTGSIVVLMIAAVDLTYLVHYRAMANKSHELERVLNAHYRYRLRSAGRAQSRKLLLRLLASLELGQVSKLVKASVPAMWRSRDARTWMFVVLAAIGMSSLLWIGSDMSGDDDVCLMGFGGDVIRVEGLPSILEGSLTIVACDQ
jgi:hypothetical protein